MNVHGQLDMNGESNYIDENFEPNYSENEYSISTEEGISTNILEQKTHTPYPAYIAYTAELLYNLRHSSMQ